MADDMKAMMEMVQTAMKGQKEALDKYKEILDKYNKLMDEHKKLMDVTQKYAGSARKGKAYVPGQNKTEKDAECVFYLAGKCTRKHCRFVHTPGREGKEPNALGGLKPSVKIEESSGQSAAN